MGGTGGEVAGGWRGDGYAVIDKIIQIWYNIIVVTQSACCHRRPKERGRSVMLRPFDCCKS